MSDNGEDLSEVVASVKDGGGPDPNNYEIGNAAAYWADVARWHSHELHRLASKLSSALDRLDELSKAHSDACSIAQDYLRKATTAEMERDAALSRNAAPTQPVDQEDVIVNAMRDGLKGADPDGGYVSDLDRYNGRTIIDGEFDLRLVARTILAKINSRPLLQSPPEGGCGSSAPPRKPDGLVTGPGK